MSVATTEAQDRPATTGRGWQVGLGELTVWVVGCGIALGFARRAEGLARSGFVGMPRELEWAAMPLAAWSAWILIVEAVRLARGTIGDRGRSWRAVAIGWRAVAAMALGLLVSGGRFEVLLRLGLVSSNWRPNAIHSWDEARITAMTLGVLLGLAGLVLGLAPPSPRSDARGRRRRVPPWASVVVVGLSGVAIAAMMMTIPYLVVVALECVDNALLGRDVLQRGPWAPLPGLWERLADLAPAAGLGVGSCLLLASLIASDARRPDLRLGSWRALAARLPALAAAAGMAAYLGIVAIPTVHPHLAIGVFEVLALREVRFLVLGIAAFAAGLAARSVAPRPAEGPPGPWDRLRRKACRSALVLLVTAAGLIVAILVLASGPVLRALFGPEPHMTHGGHLLLRASDFLGMLAPEMIFAELALAWLALQVFVRSWAASGRSWRPAAFDMVGDSRATLGRFAWLTTAITVLFLAALPTLFVAGLVAFHLALNAADLWAGWP
jgi:hypothetical protein